MQHGLTGKIENPRGRGKCFSEAELEGRPDADRPVRVVMSPVQGLGVVEPQDYEAEHVGADRAAPAAQRRAHLLRVVARGAVPLDGGAGLPRQSDVVEQRDRKSTRLNSSHVRISYAVFCLKQKKVRP